ncbi:MAG: AMP-binding protein [Microbacteriaceae bacterium]|nr:AMP-binding protein [Burkholderiaceae bacterium]
MIATQSGPSASALLLRALARYPDRIAFRWDGLAGNSELSYRATAETIGRMQAVFGAAGLARGTRVAVLAANQLEAWCATQAALASGMVSTALHQLGSLDDHLFQLLDFSAEVLVADGGTFGARAAELAQRHAGLKQVYTLAAADFGTCLAQAMARVGHASMRDLSQVDALAVVNYTGGTTGRSKGAARTQAGLAAMVIDKLSDFDLPERPHYLAAAPMTHVAGTVVLPTLLRGGTVRLMAGFQPDRLLQLIERERINLTLLVPTMIYTLLDHPALDNTDLSSLHTLLYGASPMSPTRLVEGLARIGPVFAQLYGQTEGYPISFLTRSDHAAQQPELFSSCGQPTSGSQVLLVDEDDQPVAPGAVGELCVRSRQVMAGYLNQPELTAATLKGGWLHTGDLARADERGYLYIVDRKKDMIVSGGFNVYPRDVEDVISSHPAVAMVAVIGVPDAKWGEAVTAMVLLKPGASVDAEWLVAMVRDKKGSVQAPKHIEFITEMPRTAVGKIDKKVLRAPFWAGQGRQVG